MDLVWLIAKIQAANGSTFDAPTPSDIEWKKTAKDTRSAKQIKEGLLKKLREK